MHVTLYSNWRSDSLFFSHLRASARTHTRLSVISHPIMPKEKRTIKMNVRRNRNKKKITTTTTHDKFFGESKTENISSSCLSITSIWSCIRKKRRRKISSTRILKGYWKKQQQQNQKKEWKRNAKHCPNTTQSQSTQHWNNQNVILEFK